MHNNQTGLAPLITVFGLLLILAIAGGSYYLGKSVSKTAITPENAPAIQPLDSPSIATLSTPSDVENWKSYKIAALDFEFKIPPDLANKYGKLVEKEMNGERGSELSITFANEDNFKITAQSPEFTPLPSPQLTVRQYEGGVSGGPSLSVAKVFQGFKYENESFYGKLPFGQTIELPKEHVTQYHLNGRDILKVKALYGNYGMVSHKIFPEDPPKIWGIINDTGNHIYQGLTVEGVLSEELTEPIFEQILSTFAHANNL